MAHTFEGNTNKSFNSRGVQFVWDSTSLKLAEECPRKYKYTLIDGWQAPGRSVHLDFGAWYATALEHFHKLRAGGMSYDDAVCEVVSEALISSWVRNWEAINEPSSQTDYVFRTIGDIKERSRIGEGSPWESGHNLKTRETLIRTIIWYLDQFQDDSMSTVILADGKPAVELSFLIPISDDLFLSGHMDRLVEYSGDIFVTDNKTTGSTISARYFDGWNPDIQMSMYTFAGKMIYKMPISGVVIDAAQIAVGFTRFERGFTFRSTEQLDEWYDQVQYLIQETQAYTKEDYFPMRTSACGNYGGCQFRDVCSRSPSVRDNFLRAKFIQGPTWDPAARR